MNSHLNYLIGTQRAADLRREAERQRLGRKERVAGPNGATGESGARTVVRVRLRDAWSRRLRVRRV